MKAPRCLKLGLLWLGALASCSPHTSDDEARSAVVINEVLAGGGGEEAGLLANDRVLEFRRAANPPENPEPFVSAVTSCLDLALLEIEQAPRGAVELTILRPRANGVHERLRIAVAADEWRVRLRTEPVATDAERAWETLRLASEQGTARDKETKNLSEESYRTVERWARANGEDRLLALLLNNRTRLRLEMQNFEGALANVTEALALRREGGEETLATAQAWALLGQTQNRRQDFEAAKQALERARAIQVVHAPGSLALAATENLFAIRAGILEDFTTANQKLRAALTIAEAKLPISRNVGSVLINLGNVARHLGRLDEAERFQRQAFAIYRRVEPDGPRIPDILDNLGTLALARGDLERAERLYRSSLRLFRERQPGGPAEASALSNLGLIALARGDGASAETQLLAAIALLHPLAAESATEAGLLSSLSEAARLAGSSERARDYADRALAIHRQIAPQSTPMVRDLTLTASLAIERGDAKRARADLVAARRLIDDLPHTVELASAIVEMADLLARLGDVRAARECNSKALEILSAQSPGSALEAAALSGLARLAELEHSNDEALDLYLRAIAALDAQVGRLGGSNLDRARLRGRHADAYRGAIRLLVAEGDAEAAYAVLERSRARTLLDLLAERDLEPPTELPLELREERARIEGDLARLQTEAESPAAERGGGALDVWVAKRRRLLGERSALVERLRRASPRYAALTAPEPLGLDAARRTLDADTLGLTYSVGERETILFVLFPQGFRGAPRSGLEAIRLGVGRDGNEGSDGNDANVGLAAEVAAFRSLLLARQGLENPTFRRLAESLSQKLLGPAAHHLPAAQRLAISPDGPLSLLPFAALVIPTTHDSKPTSDPAYLASRFAHYTIASATLAEELRRRAADRASHRKEEVWPLVAFGDPNDRARVESATPNRGTASRAWSRSQLKLPPLPASAREVRSIGALFDRTTLRLGHNATEAEFLAVAPHGTRVHFAGHALLDSRFPLESALALAPPAARSRPDDDGLLQAWEIFERLRLSADLVALSACDTALGQEAGGEGLLGLTRAFHFAGARTVLASLWSVLDRSSSELMTAFYRRLAAGEEADDALAAAQREMLSGPNRAPFHWAAFELDGNPRGIAEPKNSNPR